MNNTDIMRKIITEDWSFPDHNGGYGLFGLHPYPAKFIPQIPEKVINYLEISKDQLIFDPFSGSGTSLIVGQNQGYEVMGVDLNPIAVLISRVSTSKIPEGFERSFDRCVQRIKTLKDIQIPDIPNVDHWFKKDIQEEISKIRFSIDEEPSPKVKDILNLALSSVIVKVSNQESDTRYAAINKNITSSDINNFFISTVISYLDILHEEKSELPPSTILNHNSLNLENRHFPKKIGLTITSPPYPNAYEYWLYHKYRMYWLGYDPQEVKRNEIGARPHYFKKNPEKPEAFQEKMSQLFRVLRQNTSDDGYVCFVVGDSKIHGEIIDNSQMVINAGRENGFSDFIFLPREIKSHRKAFNLKNSRAKNEVSTKSVYLHYHDYKYFRYEKIFSSREVLSVPGLVSIDTRNKDFIHIKRTSNDSFDFSDLVYFDSIHIGEDIQNTNQSKIENGNKSRKVQNTRYGVHGLHEYKGKFNPQVVKGVLNSYGIRSSKVLDPFCGSGTSLIEGSHLGNEVTGFDINPFAVFLSNTKFKSQEINIKTVQDLFKKVISSVDQSNEYEILNEERESYLSSWFPEKTKIRIERYRTILNNYQGIEKDFLLLCMSNILRDYSYQEPSDLRIRRRKSEFSEMDLIDSLNIEVERNLEKISVFQKGEFKGKDSVSIHLDIRDKESLKKYHNKFDFGITSPPYATALPYIDTQRLSSVWLDLIHSSEIRQYEKELIGSREISKSDLDKLKYELFKDDTLPSEVSDLCKNFSKKLKDSDGFRKQAKPYLLYRYFLDMRTMFQNLLPVFKKNSYFCLIVGTNMTRIGDIETIINTPEYLSIVADNVGYEVVELISLETYQRYGVHSKNAINHETMIVLRVS